MKKLTAKKNKTFKSMENYSDLPWENITYEKTESYSKKNRYCICLFPLKEQVGIDSQLQKIASSTDHWDIIIVDDDVRNVSSHPDLLKITGSRTLLRKKEAGDSGEKKRIAFAYALSQGYEGIVVADGIEVPGEISQLIEKLDAGYDYIQGSRFISRNQHREKTFLHRINSQRLQASMISLASGFLYTDNTDNIKAYSKNLLLDNYIQLFRRDLSDDELYSFLAIESARRRDYRVIEVSVRQGNPNKELQSKKNNHSTKNLSSFKTLFRTAMGSKNRKVPLWQHKLRYLTWGAFCLILFFFTLYQGELFQGPKPFLAYSQPTTEAIHLTGTKALKEWSFSGWIKPNAQATGTEQRILQLDGTLRERLGYLSTYSPAAAHKGLHFGVANFDGGWGRAITVDKDLINMSGWSHVAAIAQLKTGYLELFYNGQQVGRWQITQGGFANNLPTTLHIGDAGGLETKNVKIFKKAITPRDVKNLYRERDRYPWSSSVIISGILLGAIALALINLIYSIGCHPQINFKLKKDIYIVNRLCMSLIIAFLFYQSSQHNIFGISNNGWFKEHQKDSELLALNGLVSLIHTKESISFLKEYGTGVLVPERNSYGEALAYTFSNNDNFILEGYSSQLGLQRWFFYNGLTKFILKHFNRSDFSLFQSINSFYYAIVVTGIVSFLMWGYSLSFGLGIMLGLLFSSWLTVFSRNLYWVPWTWFLPLLIVVLVYSLNVSNLTRKALLFSGVAFSFCLKSLCGYEYLSTIALATAAFAFLGPRTSYNSRSIKLFPALLDFLTIMIASVTGFMVTIFIHASLRSNNTSIWNGVKSIFIEDVMRRTLSDDPFRHGEVYARSLMSNSFDVLGMYLTYYESFAPGLSFASCFVLYLVMLITYNQMNFNEQCKEKQLLCFVSCQFLAAISWFMLAKGHSFIHTTMNYVLWSVCFVPSLIAWVFYRFSHKKINYT